MPTFTINLKFKPNVGVYMGVSKNSGTPKWRVYNGKLFKIDEFWGTPIFGNIHI